MLFFYEGNANKPIIYEIRNRLTNRGYIGQGGKCKRRWDGGYKSSLLKNKCHNSFFQNDFNKCLRMFGYELNDLIIVKLKSSNIFFNISAPFFFKTLVQSNVLEIVLRVDSYNSSWKKLDFSPWKLDTLQRDSLSTSWKRKNKDTTNI